MRKIFTLLLALLWLPIVAMGENDPTTYDISSGDISITESGIYVIQQKDSEATTNTITVQEGLTNVSITLDGVNIDVSETEKECAFNMYGAEVNLILKGDNTLKSGNHCAGIWTGQQGVLTITENAEGGELDAIGGDSAAGIGGSWSYIEDSKTSKLEYSGCGEIIIKGGKIKATGDSSAGIGVGYQTQGSGNITIEGGEIEVGNTNPSTFGIGGSNIAVTITGGKVTAKGKSYEGCGISGGDIKIKGGEITVGGTIGIGRVGYSDSDISIVGGTIKSTGIEKIIIGSSKSTSSTIVIGPDVIFNGEKEIKGYTKGFVFEGEPKEATVKGSFTLVGLDITLDKGEKLIIPEGASLTNTNGMITNNGVIENNGKITNQTNGQITVGETGVIKNYGEIIGKDNTTSPTPVENSHKIINNGTVENYGTITDKQEGSGKYKFILKKEDIKAIDPIPYKDGEEIKPEVEFVEGIVLTKDEDYTLSYENNTEVTEEAKVIITPTEEGLLLNEDAITVKFRIIKADPKYTVPTDLKAIHGQTLGDVELPTVDNGTWSWQDPESTPVGNAGPNTFKATFTPEDTENYNTKKDIEIKVTVAKASTEIADFTVKDKEYDGNSISITAAPSVTGGTLEGVMATLSYVQINGEAEITLEGAPTNVGKYKVTASYVGDDNHNAAENVTKEFQITPKPLALSFENETIEVIMGEEVPTNTLTGKEDAQITYTSSKTEVATVAEDGTVTLVGAGETTITATATGNYTGEAHYTLIVNEPMIPDPEPEDPVVPDLPNYYNIYVEDCEGVTVELTKAVVREGNSTSFTIEIAEGYNAEEMEVTVKRSLFGYSEIITPDKDGRYNVSNIWTDIYITVKGVEEENPTGIEDIDGIKVYTKDGSVYVETSQLTEVMIVSMNGMIMNREQQIGLKRYDLPRGIYIINVGDQSYKVRI